jgi:hypothetical protein
MKNYPNTSHPLAICMWDYSWLQCGHPGGQFHDLPRRVAEAAERGYDTLRVDVFPHFYLKREHTFPEQGMDRRVRTWGDVLQKGGYTVDVRRKVIELADLCRRHKLRLALDTWMSFAVLGPQLNGAKFFPRRQEEKLCRDWADTWAKALRLMRDDGVLERAAWVAPLNEVPLFLGAMLESVKVSDPEVRHEGQTRFRADLPELDAIFRQINTWLGEAIAAEIATERIPLAYSALGAENYADRLTDIYDLADVHFMPDTLLDEADKTALEHAGKGASKFSLHPAQDPWNLKIFSDAWNEASRKHREAMCALARDYAAAVHQRLTLPSGKRLHAVVTEAYGPCNHPDHAEVDWTEYQHWNAAAFAIFAEYPFVGLTLSNHAEPIFSLWDDVAWQQQGNRLIHAAGPKQTKNNRP